MEFFAEVANTNLNAEALKTLVTIERLPRLCPSISSVLSDETVSGKIYCLWGEFNINREEIRDGVRFSLPNCPNALAWTVTSDDRNNTVIHCTINTNQHDPDFIESIELFVTDWHDGIKNAINHA